MAKNVMTKSVTKKKNRRLKKQIRKTVGALLMVSAIAVAAIPVPDVRADDEMALADTKPLEAKAWVWDADMTSEAAGTGKPNNPAAIADYCETTVPTVADTETIYTSGDGKIQFAYVSPVGGGNKVAVILNYVADNLPNGTLTIQNTLEAFRKYRPTSTDGYYCLVTKNNEFMFYDAYEHDSDIVNGERRYKYNVLDLLYGDYGVDDKDKPAPAAPTQDLAGKPVVVYDYQISASDGKYHWTYTTKGEEGEDVFHENTYTVDRRMVINKRPCYYNERDIASGWGELEDSQLYYLNESVSENDPNRYVSASGENHNRIEARVAYIGKQFIEEVKDTKDPTIITGWQIKKGAFRTKPMDGVFAGNTNIENLNIGESLSGISDYAFYGTSIKNITFGNNLTTIGNGAFENCVSLQNVTMPEYNNIKAFGKNAFKDCVNLTSFQVPNSIYVIGDSCFEGCRRLQNIELQGGDGQDESQYSRLRYIGNCAFKNCESLNQLYLPAQYSENNLDIGVFEGCRSLQTVRVPNSDMTFTETSGSPCTFEDFKNTVPSSFYFWGADTDSENRDRRSALHVTANDKEIAYKYWDRNLYEIVKSEEDNPNNNITYQVNDSNELERIWIKGAVNVVIPSTIGPYGIATIGAGCFDNACELKKVTIPASVQHIADEAFKGSHELTTIIFEDSTTVQDIGRDAFRTQEASCNKHTVTNPEPKLTIVGAMMNAAGEDTVPFAYAMQRENMINNTSQNESWITYHSGWPTNLEIKYNYDFTTKEGGSELQSYPRYSNFIQEGASGIEPNLDNIRKYVKNLPYVDVSKKDKDGKEIEVEALVNVISEAIKKYEGQNSSNPPTVEEMQIINASRNVVVPTNVEKLKKGIFSGYTYEIDKDGNTLPTELSTVDGSDTYLTTILLNGVDIVDPFTFTGCTGLTNASIINAKEIGDYAFGDLETLEVDKDTGEETGKIIHEPKTACESLTNVTLGPNIVTTGLRPFRGCNSLIGIECLGDNLSYVQGSGLLFNHADGGKTLVECLPGRGKNIGSVSVKADELAGVTGLQEESFMDCNFVRSVDLSTSQVKEIKRSTFENADQLSLVQISNTTQSIQRRAFANDPMLNEITIPSSVTYLANGIFDTKPDQQNIEVTCKNPSAAYTYAMSGEYGKYMSVNTNMDEWYWAQFMDYPNFPDTSVKDGFGELVRAKVGEAAPTPAATPSPHNGYVFAGWLNNDPNDIANLTVEILPRFSSASHLVKFIDGCQENSIGTIEEQIVEDGKMPNPYPEPPEHPGWVFDKWVPEIGNTGVKDDSIIIAYYKSTTEDSNIHTVTYYDLDGNVYTTQRVGHGEAASPVAGPPRTGYTFVRWAANGDLSKVESDLVATPMYNPGNGADANPSGGAGGNGANGGNGNNGNNNGAGSSASPRGSASAAPTATPANGSDVVKYTVTVSGGSGTGSYPAGAVVAINAYAMGTGQVFDKWTSSTAGVGFADATATSTTFTMPAANVAVTATYKTGGTGTAATNASNGSNGGISTASVNNGSSVEVSKPGISNTNLAGATVTGATDNFIIKISEDQSATDAATSALQARFGDLSRIKYFPMDISLYDSTGRTKIADTSGISVNLTLPLPDELIQYAGNNKMAAISGGALEDLNARFTTVSGVPCINFTATHFSPYVIYVDTANLTEATIDSTPKTGDPIHPKWFLALGMASLSLILFFKRDKVSVKTKAA
ncbi:MAG: leucine-rich repeat protein [Clostridium sp.]|nr:leucine-rich repeat protein [Clostridium sp.]